MLKEYLGADTVGWLYNGELEGDDTDGHIDTLARIVPPGDTIVYVGCSDTADSLSILWSFLCPILCMTPTTVHACRRHMPIS